MRTPIFGLMAGLLLSLSTARSDAKTRARELGDVSWSRNYETARKRARAENKPLLILFDEVPGCQTCVRYGQAVLNHPLVVEAAETLFVPVAIYNNLGGSDRTVLERYKEPTWNNPVVRIVSAEEKGLASRIAGDYSIGGLVHGMVAALETSGHEVPEYLRILAAEHLPLDNPTARAAFAMPCFWTGEVCLGDLEGIVSTRTGFLEGHEVVEVEYDPRRLSYASLVRHGREKGCISQAFARTTEELDAARSEVADHAVKSTKRVRGSSKDDKYQLRHSTWRFVPMTELQATRANHLIGRGRDPEAVFSPQQIALHRMIVQNPKEGWRDYVARQEPLREAFATATALAKR